jgi:hypothetical protein
MIIHGLIFLFVIFSALNLSAEEESLDLSKEVAASPVVQKIETALAQLKIMGRVDLTYEYYPNVPNTSDGFKNYHYFLFLKTAVSPKVTFMGEVLQQEFYDITYKPAELVSFHFGKILVPFGDASNYHHFYGGLQGYGPKGVMFPNIWAEYGVDAVWKLGNTALDTYTVSGITSSAVNAEPTFNAPSNNLHQAAGVRESVPLFGGGLKLIASGYYTDWLPSHSLYLVGGDLATDYRLIDAIALRNMKLSLGRAIGFVKNGVAGDYQKAGDYVQLATNALPFAETRLRYGTYIDNSAVQTQADTHSINVAMIFPIDVLKLMAEYQWNFEAVNELPNDVARLMLSLDF